MALIKCSECGKEFSDKDTCPNCGCPVDKMEFVETPKKDDLVKCVDCGKEFSKDREACPKCGCPIEYCLVKEEKEKEEVPKKKEIVKKAEIKNDSNIKEFNYINQSTIGIIVNILFILFVLVVKTIVTRKSGLFNIILAIEWILGINSNVSSLLLTLYIMICYVLGLYDKTKFISKIGYILMFIVELLFLFLFHRYGWSPTFGYILFLLVTLGYIVYLFIFAKGKNGSKKTISNNKEKIDSRSNLDEIKKLKELYDMNAITKEEYNDLKKKMLENEMQKWDK